MATAGDHASLRVGRRTSKASGATTIHTDRPGFLRSRGDTLHITMDVGPTSETSGIGFLKQSTPRRNIRRRSWRFFRFSKMGLAGGPWARAFRLLRAITIKTGNLSI